MLFSTHLLDWGYWVTMRIINHARCCWVLPSVATGDADALPVTSCKSHGSWCILSLNKHTFQFCPLTNLQNSDQPRSPWWTDSDFCVCSHLKGSGLRREQCLQGSAFPSSRSPDQRFLPPSQDLIADPATAHSWGVPTPARLQLLAKVRCWGAGG